MINNHRGRRELDRPRTRHSTQASCCPPGSDKGAGAECPGAASCLAADTTGHLTGRSLPMRVRRRAAHRCSAGQCTARTVRAHRAPPSDR